MASLSTSIDLFTKKAKDTWKDMYIGRCERASEWQGPCTRLAFQKLINPLEHAIYVKVKRYSRKEETFDGYIIIILMKSKYTCISHFPFDSFIYVHMFSRLLQTCKSIDILLFVYISPYYTRIFWLTRRIADFTQQRSRLSIYCVSWSSVYGTRDRQTRLSNVRRNSSSKARARYLV